MQDRSPLDGLLEVCDQLRNLQDLASRGARLPEESLHKTRQQVESLGELVFPQLPGIQQTPEADSLCSQSLLILALLFHGKISESSEAYSGIQLCGLLMRADFSRSTTLDLLGPTGPLRSEGWVQCEATIRGLDPLDSYFRPSSKALNLFWLKKELLAADDGTPSAFEDSDSASPEIPQPFSDEGEYLWEIGDWRHICMQRAGALFETDLIAEEPSPRLAELRETAHAKWVHLRRRLAVTPGGRDFGLERLAASHKLGPDHILIIAHMFFAEILDVELYLTPGECLRLVSGHRDDLLQKRPLLSAQGRLRREGLVVVDGEESAKMLAVPLCLADWVVERVLAGVGRSLKWNQQELEEFLRGDGER
ncbi:MAG: hypothetical protein O3A95_03845 [Planctomycetota bacterium]|nr:hypothetical protein [Planctomycetota bacterium]MDA1113415.1 hypothetical protein [Planctomycetota bacterium]